MNSLLVICFVLILIQLDELVASNNINKRQAPTKCKLPLHPENGRWNLLSGEGRPGNRVNVNSILKYECNPDYILSQNNSYVICDKGWSVDPLPTCEKLCPPVYSTAETIVNCFNKKGEAIACNHATDESYLRYECIPFYEPFGPKKNIFCSKGTWNYPAPVCQPICGRKVGDGTKPLAANGTPLKTIKYPWIVALYNFDDGEWTNICGGSIISPRFVLTAAHCVTNGYGQAYPVENYKVAAAKLYNKYQDKRDEVAQYLDIVSITVHSEYNGETRRYLGDIAMLKTKTQFVLGPLIQPVCIHGVNDIYLHAGDIGEVAGWGLTEHQEPSDEMRFLEIPYKHPSVCNQELPTEWGQKYNLIDKMCVGFYRQNISVCSGDSGSGLVFKNPEDSRYYIHGIVSIAPTKNELCDIQQNSLYTKVAFHIEFVELQLTKNSGECRLPQYPKNGRWSIEKNPNKVPGDLVAEDEQLKIECNEGYTISSSNDLIDCQAASYSLPICERTCPPLTTTKITSFKCTDRRGGPIDCTKATEGSVVSYECTQFYEQKVQNGSSIVCLNGAWNASTLDCQPVCGKPIDIKQDERNFKYPWVVAIYGKSEADGRDKFEFLCGGTLISRNLIITGAFCVSDSNGDFLEKEDYEVAAAKYYMKYDEARDKNAEFLKVREIKKHESYKGISQNFLGNIAVLITKGYFTLGPLIQPACIRNLDEVELETGDHGVVSGWSTKNSNQLSEHLVNLDIPYKSQQQCTAELPKEFSDTYYFRDKLCAGLYKKNQFVCRGDGGTGLVFKNPEDDRFYIHGIVALAPLIDVDCDPEQNALYTNVKTHYKQFISKTFLDFEEICRLPPYPENGHWVFRDDPNKTPGDLVGPIEKIEFQCSEGYRHSFPIANISCKDAKLVSKCDKLCPPLAATTWNVTYKCERNGQEIDCSEATEGTTLDYQCPPYYEKKNVQEDRITCSNGDWNVVNIECQPICGQKTSNGTLPWVVAIYKGYVFACGGTLISRNVILTAAFCVADALSANSTFEISAGKRDRSHSRFVTKEEPTAQYLKVEHVFIHPDYRGPIQNYFGNIAILVTKGLFTITSVVQPACVRNVRQLEDMLEKQEKLAHPTVEPAVVSGWGTKRDDLLSNDLIDLEIPFKPQYVCLDELPQDFLNRYNSVDKWCAGLYDLEADKGVCNGDAGSGIVYKNNVDNRYYVLGVVSLTPLSENTCDIKQNTLFTKVSFAYDFVIGNIDKYDDDFCRLPPHPNNGKWMLGNSNEHKAGDLVSKNKILTIVCSDGYSLASVNETLPCKSSFKLPKCYSLCPSLKFPAGTTVLCKNKSGGEVDCNRAIEDIVLTFSCPPRYSALPGTTTKVCKNGAWSNSNSTCVLN